MSKAARKTRHTTADGRHIEDEDTDQRIQENLLASRNWDGGDDNLSASKHVDQSDGSAVQPTEKTQSFNKLQVRGQTKDNVVGTIPGTDVEHVLAIMLACAKSC